MDRAVDVAGAMAAVWLPLWGSVTLKTGMVLCIAGLCWLIVRRRSAAVRHFLLASTVCVLAALPTLTLVMPAWSVRALPAGISRLPAPPTAPAAFSADEPPPSPNPAGASPARDLSHDGRPEPTGAASAPNDIPPTASAVAAESVVHHTSATAVAMVNALPSALLLVWLSGVGLVVLRYANGLGRLVALLRRSTPMAASDVDAILPGIARTVRIVVGGTVPLTFGWLRPVLVVPADFADWPDGRRRAVVLHEYAHIARRDWVANLVAQIGCALYWYNPFVWLIARRMCIEAEHACDDRVLLAGIAPADYATHLLDVAKSMRLAGRVPAAAIAMASRPMIKDRMQSILDAGRLRRTVSMKSAIAGTLIALAAALPLAAVRLAAKEPRSNSDVVGIDNGQSVLDQIMWSGDAGSQADSVLRPTAFYSHHLSSNRLTLVGQFDWDKHQGFYLNLENSSNDGDVNVGSLKVALGVADSSGFHYAVMSPIWRYGHRYHVHVTITPHVATMLLDGQQVTVQTGQLVAATSVPLVLNSRTEIDGFPAEYWAVAESVSLRVGTESNFHYDLPGGQPTAGPNEFADPQPRQDPYWTVVPGKVLTIDAVFRLVRRSDYAPQIDRYGQSRYPTWPGKVTTDQQLSESVTQESEELARSSGLAGFDPYGGKLNAGWTEPATGYYQVVSRGGFYWLITPNGDPCWYTAICNAPDLGSDTGTPVTGREADFAYLPPGAANAQGSTQYVSFAALNMERKYGAVWKQREALLLKQRMTSWGFIGEGEGSDRLDGLPYQQMIWQDQPAQDQLDVFDSRVRKAIKSRLQQEMQADLNDPYLVGWSVGSGAPYVTASSVSALVRLSGASPVKQALIAYALANIYHGAIAQMAKRWNARAKSKADLAELPDVLPASDASVLCAYLADQYYAYLYATVKAIDPNHLYFGDWLYIPTADSSANIAAIAAHCDVFSFSIISDYYPGDYISSLINHLEKPLFWSRVWCIEDYGGARGFGIAYGERGLTDADTGASYKGWVSAAAVSPVCIGMSWFQYRDQPVTGIGPGSGGALVYGPNHAYGIVDVTDRPKWDLVDAMREANLAANQERLDATAASTE